MGLGTLYPFGYLNQGECLISSAFAENYQLVVGSQASININLGTTWHSIVEQYNAVATLNKWTPYVYVSRIISTQCTVAGILGGTYGKYMNTDIDGTVIMEYENFLPFLEPFVPSNNT